MPRLSYETILRWHSLKTQSNNSHEPDHGELVGYDTKVTRGRRWAALGCFVQLIDLVFYPAFRIEETKPTLWVSVLSENLIFG
ncbi:hypothetical protein [Oculatella sp. FACHB-28]|uniref:hypothetical protein n=1 Tax=Oculatella sp. FACHB-28 TaxID=2692845 RepID=UPI001F54F211|nr:hypothetical protein [Oculatella sp. FACHB-28]